VNTDDNVGTGIWAVEMAREFPKAHVIGVDLAPYATNDKDLPPNLELVLADCVKGLPYPDAHFDIVHARLIVGGIRDWGALLDEIVRVTNPGGLMVLAESAGPWPMLDPVPEGVGQGYLDSFGPTGAVWRYVMIVQRVVQCLG
jgi:ubiquinone/menaquinone biosynthesis C-methylase UbiE